MLHQNQTRHPTVPHKTRSPNLTIVHQYRPHNCLTLYQNRPCNIITLRKSHPRNLLNLHKNDRILLLTLPLFSHIPKIRMPIQTRTRSFFSTPPFPETTGPRPRLCSLHPSHILNASTSPLRVTQPGYRLRQLSDRSCTSCSRSSPTTNCHFT